MLIRIVRMTFKSEKIADFLALFGAAKNKIRAMPGCQHLELLQDIDNPDVFVTYSYWDDATALNHYRDSDLFKETWAKTKLLFAEKSFAYSVKRIEIIDNK